MSFQLESEIKSLMEQHQDLELVAESLIQNFQESFLSEHEAAHYADTVQEICRFFLITGQYQTLVRFSLRHLPNPRFPFPWKYFIEALSQGAGHFEKNILDLIKAGVAAENVESEVALANGAYHFIDDPSGLKKKQKRERAKKLADLRTRLHDEVLTLRTQQLFEKEKAQLLRLLKLFPEDPVFTAELKSHRERRALDVLSRYSPLGRGPRTEGSFENREAKAETVATLANVKESMQTNLASSPALAFDFAMAAYMMEDFESCAEILEKTELTVEQQWFQLEVKLKCRRFLEVLQEVNKLEIALASDPETFFATAYIRAQAYWGLDQKHIAIEILESILSVRPHYRAGATLLDLWRAP